MSDPDNTSALWTEFRAISMALRVTTAANRSGHSTLVPLHRDGLPPSLSGRHSRTDEITEAIASLLVRGKVVVTCIHPQPDKNSDWSEFVVVAQDAQGRDTDEEEGNDGLDGQRTAWLWRQGRNANLLQLTGKCLTWQSIAKSSLPANFLAFTNASLTGSHFHKDSKHLVKLVETGKSHWPAISLLDPKDILDPNKLR